MKKGNPQFVLNKKVDWICIRDTLGNTCWEGRNEVVGLSVVKYEIYSMHYTKNFKPKDLGYYYLYDFWLIKVHFLYKKTLTLHKQIKSKFVTGDFPNEMLACARIKNSL